MCLCFSVVQDIGNRKGYIIKVIGRALQRESEEKEERDLQINKGQSRLGKERQVIGDEE